MVYWKSLWGLVMKKYVSPLLLLAAAFFWGISFPIQNGVSELGLFTYYASRSLIAVVFLSFVVVFYDKVTRTGRHLFGHGKAVDITAKEWKVGIVCGLLLFAASLLQQLGMQIGIESGKSAFITALYSVFVPVLGLFLGRRPKAQIWICLPVAVAGFFLLSVKEGFTVEPQDLVTLLCALVFALQIMVVDHYVADCCPIRLSLVQFFAGGVLAGVLLLITGEKNPTFFVEPALYLGILYLGVMSSGVAYTAQIVGQRGTDPSVASLLLCMESVFAVIAAGLFGECLTGREICGCILVFLAVASAQIDFTQLKNKIKIGHKDDSVSE